MQTIFAMVKLKTTYAVFITWVMNFESIQLIDEVPKESDV